MRFTFGGNGYGDSFGSLSAHIRALHFIASNKLFKPSSVSLPSGTKSFLPVFVIAGHSTSYLSSPGVTLVISDLKMLIPNCCDLGNVSYASVTIPYLQTA